MRIKDLPKPIRLFILKYLWFRPGIIYAYSCIDPSTGLRELWAYVGQTRQQLIERHDQHMGQSTKYKTHRQPWSDLYPEVRIVWEGNCPGIILDLIEKYYIKRYRALYNYIHNTNNPRRITKPEAEYQRLQRDQLANARRIW